MPISEEKKKIRQNIYNYFIKVANDENSKNQKPQDFRIMLDCHRNNKRALLIIKQSIGDCILVTQLLESFKKIHKDIDLYLATDPQYFEIFEGNTNIHKVIQYQSFMESEMACIGTLQNKGDQYFDYYFHTAIGTQRILNYLSVDKFALELS